MGDPVSVRCPACQARLTLKDKQRQGRRISCPKCGKGFVVPAPAATQSDDEWLAEPEDSTDAEFARQAPPIHRSSGRRATKRERSTRPAWLFPALIAGGVAIIGIVVVSIVSNIRFGNQPPVAGDQAPESAQNENPVSPSPASVADSTDQTAKERRGTWTNNDGVLTSPEDPVALFPLADRPPEEYTVSLKARRLSGTNTFAIGIPVGEQQVLLALDAHAGTVSGLEYLDGKHVHENEATYKGRLLLPDREVTIKCTVRKDGIRCTCDEVTFVDWKGDLRKLSLPPEFAVPDKKALFLVTLESRVAVREISVSPPSSDSPAAPTVASSSPPPAADASAPLRFEDGNVRLVFPAPYKQAPDVKNTTYLTATDAAGNSYGYLVKVLPPGFAKKPPKSLLAEEQRTTLQIRDTSKLISSDFRKISRLPGLVLTFESNEPSEGARKHWLAMVDREHVLHTLFVSGPPTAFDQKKVDQFLASLQIRSASGFIPAGNPASDVDLPRGLLTGKPTLPKVAADDAAKPLLRIAVAIRGTDELRIFPDRVEWVHGAGLHPFQIMLNKLEWYPKRTPTLKRGSNQAIVPKALKLETADVSVESARDAVSWQVRSDHFSIQFRADQLDNDAETVVGLLNGPAFPEAKPNAAALKQVTDKVGTDGGRPLPADQKPAADQDLASLSLEWRRSRLALAYDQYGRKDARWNEAAHDYLELIARGPAEPSGTLLEAGQAVIKAGCDDPLVCCQHAERLLQEEQPAVAEQLLLHAVLAFEKSKYPKRCTRQAPALLAQIYKAHADVAKRKMAPGLLERAIVETVQAAGEPFVAGQQRAWLAELEDELGDDPRRMFAGCRSKVALALSKSRTADAWLAHVLMAESLIGPGQTPLQLDVLSAPPSGAGPFTPRLKQARDHLLEAWNLHRDFPEAAVKLITLTAEIGGAAGEKPRFWFDEAVAVKFDLQEAYERYFDTLRPSGGGTHEQMLQFAVECAATKRFDTDVPRMLLRAGRLVARDVGTIIPMLAQHKADQVFLDVMQEYERRAEADPVELKRVRSEHLVLCWQVNMFPEFRQLQQKLQGPPDAEVLKSARVSLQLLEGDGKASAIDAPEIRPQKSLVAFGGVVAIALSPDNRTLVTNSGTDWPMSIWDINKNGERHIPQPNGDQCTKFLFSADGKRLMGLQANTAHVPQAALAAPGVPSPQGSGTVLMWNMRDETFRALWPVDSYSIYSIAWHSDQRLIVVGMYGGFVVVCDADTGRHLALTDGRGPTAIEVAVSPDGKQLVVGYYDGVVRWYKLPSTDDLLNAAKPYTLEKLDEAKQHADSVDRVQFSSDGKFLITGAGLPPVCVWDAATRSPLRRLDGRSPTISPDGKYVMTNGGAMGYKRANVLWNIETGKPRVRLVAGTALLAQQSLFTTDGDFVITAGMESYISVWNVAPYK